MPADDARGPNWRSVGLDVVRTTALSRNGGGRTYQLDLRGGRILKGRLFTTARSAADVQRLLEAPGASALPRPLERRGKLLISEFIIGTPLDERSMIGKELVSFARRAGRLMADIHRGRPPAGVAPSPAWYRDRLVDLARKLVRRDVLRPDEAAQLIAIPVPARARSGLTHGDICPENLILTPEGSLVAIDEERLAVRPFAYDLARSVNRWPLDSRTEAAFLDGYADGGGDGNGFVRWRRFWVAAALATSVEYRLKHAPSTVRPILLALSDIARRGRGESSGGAR